MKCLIFAYNHQLVAVGAILEHVYNRQRYRLAFIGENRKVQVQQISNVGKLQGQEVMGIEVFGLVEAEVP